MGFTEVLVGMAPPMWVHRLAQNNLNSYRRAAAAVQYGKMYNPEECMNLGFVDEINPLSEMQESGKNYIMEVSSLPWEARLDAKMKIVKNIVAEMNEDGLNGIVDSISGNEFQGVAKHILKSLSK
jgi:enoyl-CoA hydratase/carnithine racemase